MPTGTDWADLAKETFRALDRRDVTDIYAVEWQKASDALMAEHRDAIQAQPKKLKRFFLEANAILFGLVKRLTPTRRLVFLVALILAMIGPIRLRSGKHLVLSADLQMISIVLLTLLLAMELVDKIQFRDELFLARDVQSSLIPKELPALPGFELGAFNRIANTVGGDLYDFVPREGGGLAVLFGDASGHGMSAGLIMAVTSAAFRIQTGIDSAPEVVFAALNRVLCRTGACRTGGPRQFFAGVYLRFEPDGRFSAIVAGHPPILRLDGSGAIVERIGEGAYPLGVKEAARWKSVEGRLEEGHTLLLHSDGLTEAMTSDGVEFGDERVAAVAARKAGSSARDLTSALAAELASFLGRHAPEDDVSIAAVKRVARAESREPGRDR